MHFLYIIKSFLRTAEQQVDFVFSSWPYAAETRKAYRDANLGDNPLVRDVKHSGKRTALVDVRLHKTAERRIFM